MSYILRRVASGILLILALTFITYVVFFTIPANPTCLVLDCQPHNQTTPAQFEAARHRLGLDRPVVAQYGSFLWGIVRHGSFGESFTRRYSIRSQLERAVPATASVVLGGALMLVLLAFPLGALSALRPNGLLDRAALALSLVGIALHPFVVGLLVREVFSVDLRIAPYSGYCPLRGHGSSDAFGFGEPCGGPLDWAYHLYLPWLVFALFFLPLYTRMFRARLLETLSEPWVRSARAKGASELRVFSRHVLRNGVLPILPMLAMDVGTAVTTAIYVEAIFNINGLGTLAVNALSGNPGSYDLPMIVGIVFVVACAVVVLNLLADIAVVALDPRITGRSGSRPLWRTAEGHVDRRRVATSVAVAALVAGGVAAAATFPRGGSGKMTVGALTKDAKAIGAHWTDRIRFPGGAGYLEVSVERIVVGPHGWGVTADLTLPSGQQNTTIAPGSAGDPRHAGFSLQFPGKDEFGRRTYTALPALAFDPPLPETLPVGGRWHGTFAGPGTLPHDGTMIAIAFGVFAAPLIPPTTLVSYTTFKLH